MRIGALLALSAVATVFACTFGALLLGAWLLDAARPAPAERRQQWRALVALPAPEGARDGRRVTEALGRGWLERV